MNGKLTPAQRRVLEKISADPNGLHNTVYSLGRGTCEALRKRGLVSTSHGDRAISRYFNPEIAITEAGRTALSPHIEQGETKV